MDADKGARDWWSNTQAYGLAVICLLLGIAAGYFIRGPQPPASATVVSAPQQAPQQVPDNSSMQVTPEGLKHMAEKQAEPLLAKLEKNPNDAALLAQIGKAYLNAHQFQTAVEYYERSVKIKPDAGILTTLGGVYHFEGADDKALDAWKRALQIDPNNADALFNFGLGKWQYASDPKAAVAAWNRLLKTNPNHPQRARVEEMIARAKKHFDTPAGTAMDKPYL